MELPIPKKVLKLWDEWHLRGCIILSLFLQAFLVLFASSRRRSKRTFVLFLIWSAYLLADWVAAVAIGAIIKTQGDICEPPNGNDALFAFWASFLLLHLGGPDSITSFALEDNELWLRHLLALVLQGVAAAYSMFMTLPSNKLWLPTMLVFVVGIIKYGERTFALYLASRDRIADSASTSLPNVWAQAESTSTRTRTSTSMPDGARASPGHDVQEAEASTEGQEISNSYMEMYLCDELSKYLKCSDEIILVELAYKLFQIFKGLIVNLVPSSDLFRVKISRPFLKDEHTAGALRVIEYELSIFYEILHTKVVAARRRVGFVFRFIGFFFIIGASALFFSVEKHSDQLHNFDIGLTYALLIGAVVLDFLSFIRLISSDWMLGAFKGMSWKKYVPSAIVKRRRWSESIFQYNLISYCLDEHPKWVYNFGGYVFGRRILDKLKMALFSSSEIVTEDLKLFIFAQLKARSENLHNSIDGMMASCYRGQLTLKSSPSYDKLKWSVSKFKFAESLLLWHVATELIIGAEKQSSSSSISTNGDGRLVRPSKRICKLISDYMFYLMVMQPLMMSPFLGNWDIVFQDTCAEAKRFFHKYKISSDGDHSKACEKIMSIETKPDKLAAEVKRDSESKSLLFDACKLAKELRRLEEGPWAVMDRVWAELMSFAAVNCESVMHAQQQGKGGELLSFTWLLMYHLGFGFQLSYDE